MSRIGNNLKITAPRSVQTQVRSLFEALGATTKSPNPATDMFVLESTNIGYVFVSDSEALTPAQMRNAPWIEILVDDTAAAAAKLDGIGVERVEYSGSQHPYFAAPGGAVFRLAAR